MPMNQSFRLCVCQLGIFLLECLCEYIDPDDIKTHVCYHNEYKRNMTVSKLILAMVVMLRVTTQRCNTVMDGSNM